LDQVQFQALCLFIAFFSLRSVKREKITSASLFDMRSRRRIKQEMVPLNSNTGSTNVGTRNNNSDGGHFGDEQNFVGDKSDLA
jgi:hypothetical protein